MLHFAGADTKGKCTECAVSCSVAVSTNNCHAGKRATLFWSDHVHDSLAFVTHREQCEFEFGCVVAKYLYLLCRDWVSNRQVNICSGNVVIFCCNREVWAAQWATRKTQTIKCLRAGYFVHKVQVDVHEVCFAWCSMHNMLVPDFLRKCHWFRHRGFLLKSHYLG